MRALILCLFFALACTAPSFAAEAVLPAQPPATNEPPTITAPPPSEEIRPLLQTPHPLTEVPSPVQPSTPLGPFAHSEQVPDLGTNGFYFSASEMRTTFDDNGRPALTTITSDLTARYRDFVVTAERGRVDYKTNLAVFEGNVCFRIGIQEARGERIEINIKTYEWSFTPASSTITPEFTRGYLKAPIFAAASKLSGIRDRQLSAFDAEVTTCDLPQEHYDIKADSMVVYPDDKVVFRDASFIALGKRVFTLRRFAVPIRQITRNPNVLPRVGNTAEEGFFIKYAYPVFANRSQTGFALVDLMQRKGVGVGLQDSYQTPGGRGNLYLYGLHDNNINQDTYTGRLNHTQMIGSLQANISSNFRKNSYRYAPESTTLDNRLTLTRDIGRARSSLTLSQTTNDVFQRTTQTAGNLQHRQELGSGAYLNASFDYTGYTASEDTRARLTSQVLFSKREARFDWDISAQKLTDLSDESFVGAGQFGGIERLPELSISSDTARLGRVLPFNLPARMRLSYGRFSEVPRPELDRVFLDISSPSASYQLSNSWSALVGAGFKQFVYGDDTAQYSVDASAQLTKRLADTSNFALTYRYQRPRGFTPFRFDFVGRYNIINASLNLEETDTFKLSLIGGYNFDQPRFPWQDSVIRFTIKPAPGLLFYTATGYDFNRGKLRQVINQLRIRSGDRFRLDLGSRFDPTRNKFATVAGLLDTPLGNKNRIQAVAGWNGISNSFDYRSVRLTRDLHCWEASLTYVDQGGFYNNRGVFFNLRIKAFPMLDDFGMGSFGQALDTSVGQVY